ncbi:branched-chain amino acid ABC transporter permease [Acidisphaera sp. L21]|uniref:branched-chain amino acid ABC transporter permease n=1 Tax=Acidisphaera sp. L21 TaxID=1641851 RepID=UPI0015768ED0|nr:branched-chain amino acid ABC transporter permease [Acidisphaera sp. L21]
MLAYALATGVIFGLYFALVGVGMNLVFGVMRIVNLAHGDFIMLGAFGAFWLFRGLGLPPPVVVVLCFATLFLAGLPLYYLLVPRLFRAREPEMLSLILFFGLSQVIEAVVAMLFGNNERSIPSRLLGGGPVPIMGQTVPFAWVYAGGVSLVMLAGVYVYLYRTRLGRQTRAIMAQREEAVAIGIDIHRISAIAFGVGSGLAAVAGVFAPFMLGSFTPSIGVSLDLTSFAVIVIGSLGNPLGTLLGGLIFGVSLMLMRTYLSSFADLLPNLVLIGVLLVKPTGLLGRRVRNA